jgi:CDP-diacylglycerol--glycerol-3-phosphate 3-phosphatidyltransferase
MSNQKKKGMNLPNKLTVLRVMLVPVFIVVMMLPASVLHPIISGLIGVAIFIAASVTDMLDGKIARKYGLVTDFGKLMDPLADKFMVIGALAVIVYRADAGILRLFFTLVLLVVIFRELAVTSLRLVASTSAGAVVAANLLGKIKTVVQIVFISAVFIEPALYAIPALGGFLPAWWVKNVPITYLAGALTLLFTVWSGINYFIGMWKYLDPEK